MVGLVAIAAFVSPHFLDAQAAQTRPRVFFDCNGPSCNSQYYRTEITWVNWVNAPQVADLHVIMGSLSTGAGGREYQLDFIGVNTTEAYEDQLTYNALATDTDRESLDGITHTLGLGIANWANTHGFRGLVRLQGADPELGNPGRRVVSRDEVDDPWNLWVFRINANGNRSSEATRTETQIGGGLSISRVTPTWKLLFNTFSNHRRLFVTKPSTGEVTGDIRTDWSFNPLVAYAVADHWSVGVTARVGRSVQNNQGFRVEFAPALEFSVFPYEEATRRSLTVFYAIGPRYYDYLEETIFGETRETRFQESIEISFNSRQTWGDAGFTIGASHYLHDIDLNNRSLRGDINYRLTRGISVFGQGNIAWVSDQIYLPSEGPSDEEALLNLQRQATDRESFIRLGFQLQFGSIFNNVVNNRFNGLPGFGGGGRGGGGGPF